MIQAARLRHRQGKTPGFVVADTPPEIADYGVASGVFNVRQHRSEVEWRGYLLDTLDTLDRTSRRGFSFNCLTCYSDEDRKRDYLYYADPLFIFDFCKRRYSRQIALLHDYGLYEFTVLVRKVA
ncbi:SAM (And some other nucleotide) binding motif [plant metagenome]|uniref:SAM (And some other nucleotide) binding motif n=1 Tax=plant metagenome TaxID=1297885 RepID=A0A484QXS1_9ZZZZ